MGRPASYQPHRVVRIEDGQTVETRDGRRAVFATYAAAAGRMRQLQHETGARLRMEAVPRDQSDDDAAAREAIHSARGDCERHGHVWNGRWCLDCGAEHE